MFSEVNFYKVALIFFCKYLEIYTKTISCLRFGDYKPLLYSFEESCNLIGRRAIRKNPYSDRGP